MAATKSSNAVIINLARGLNNDGDNFFASPLSTRGSTKRDAISVEDYDDDRRLHLRHRPSQPKTKVKSESPIYIDLDLYDDEDDDLRILSFTKTLEKGECSSSSSKTLDMTFDCEICVEAKPVTESFRINGCSHSYCDDCVSKYIGAKLQENIVSIECPVSKCLGRLEPDQCRRILPREVFDRWGDALCEAVIMRSKRFYCPYKDCSALLFMDESDVNMTESECPHCNRMVCVACGTKWHPEITCVEFQKLAENERGREDILLKKMAESKKWARCPSCKFYIEKSEGCLYMKCRCGVAFCYNCGVPSKNHTTHYCSSCKR